MTKDRIKQLMQSSNADDIELAIQFLGSYRIKEIREIIPGGTWYLKDQRYCVVLKPTIGPKIQHIKLSYCLYYNRYHNSLNFFTKPQKGINYISLYEKL